MFSAKSYRAFQRQINAYYKSIGKKPLTYQQYLKTTGAGKTKGSSKTGGKNSPKPTAPLPGGLSMCSVTAAGLVIGGFSDTQLVEAYLSLSPDDAGTEVPDAIRQLGREPVKVEAVTPGAVLVLDLPTAVHAVAVLGIKDDVVAAMSWNELYFLSSAFVDEFGEDIWLAR